MKKNVLKKSLIALGITSLLFTTGCATTSNAVTEEAAPSASAPAASTASPTGTPTEAPVYEAADYDLFGTPLYAGYQPVKAGESFRVTGGTYTPGETVEIQGFQIMPMPSYDAANDMYHAVGEPVPLTESITVTTDEKGQFDTTLLIPAGVSPQTMDVISQTSDGGANLVQVSVE